MIEPTSFTDMLKQFGPYGICLFLMAAGLVYQMRWLREDRKQQDISQENIRNQFVLQLKDQRTEYTTTLKQVTSDFKEAIGEHSKSIDNLSERVDKIDGHVQELRMTR